MFDGLMFKVAVGEDRLQALELQREVYMKDLGHIPQDEYDAEAHFLTACSEDGAVIGAFRLVGPEQRPFDIERFVSLADLLPPGRTPAVVGRLCVRHDHRQVSRHTFIQIGLLKLAYAFAMKWDITDFLLYTYPRLIAFYRGALFETLAKTFEHPDWGVVHLMRLDLVGLEARCAQSRGGLARLLFATELPNLVL